MHQRTSGACYWASIAQTPEHLAACGKALTGDDLAPPPAGRLCAFLRPRWPPSGGCMWMPVALPRRSPS